MLSYHYIIFLFKLLMIYLIKLLVTWPARAETCSDVSEIEEINNEKLRWN
jgi:hypothetical protein